MKILVVTERIPSIIGGGAARQLNLMKPLASRHEFTLASFSTRADAQHIDEVRPIVNEVKVVWVNESQMPQRPRFYWQVRAWQHALLSPYPRRGRFAEIKEMRTVIQRLHARHQFDIVQIHQAYLAEALPAEWVGGKLLDMHDVLSDHERRVMEQRTKRTHRLQGWLEWQKMRSFERRQVRRFDYCLAVSEVDKASLLRLAPSAQVIVVPNGVDSDYFRPWATPASGVGLVFTGSMNYTPNADAVRWFCAAILPLIHRHRPDVHLKVVGWQPPDDIVALNADPSVLVTGFVEDVRPYLAEAAVVIAPIRSGSGTRLKILDAWSMGKAVVSTSLGAEGLAIEPEGNILLADDPETFATAVLRLLSDVSLRRKLGATGRDLVQRRYTWSAIAADLDSVYSRLVVTNT